MQKKLTLVNQIDEICKLQEFVEEICEQAGFDMSVTMSLNLALEEAVTNVIDYAYPEGTEGNVDIVGEISGKQLKFIISDSGQEFDPTAAPEADITLGVEDRPIGGLGIYLVRKIMDSVSYERTDGKNVLSMTKKL